MSKVWVIVRKEWSEVFKNKMVLFAVAFLPLLFTAMPLGILATMRGSGDVSAMSGVSELPSEFSQLCTGLQGAECMQYFLVSQFMMLFMMIPVIIPVTIASYSIVGEKSTRTLEPLLATPVTTLELLGGKALAAALPAVGATWLSFLIFAIGTRVLVDSPAILARLFAPLWLLAIFLVGPLLAIAGVSVAVMVSSRVNDPRVAEQVSALVMIPLIAMLLGQSFGLIYIDETLIIWIALAMFVIDAGLLYFSVQLFQRETILTRWK
ncbi:MAG: ABC transporter permease [Anaerolineales bacterium]|nr:ABC transporter permease [Anaerolineales bacterium]